MILPLQSDDALLDDIRRVADPQSDALQTWWLGQSGFLVHWRGRFVLFDPYLSDSLTRKYAATDKPHVRMTARVIAPDRLGFVQIVTSSHNHTDHLDAETLAPMRRANPALELVIPEANRSFVAERLGTPAGWPRGLTAGATLEVNGLRFHGVPAAHNRLDTDEAGRHLYMGYVLEAGPWRLYHSGDTLRYGGMEELLRPWAVHLALLPINGDKPRRRVAGNLDGPQAARLAKAIGAGLVVPCHYEMFEFNTATPEAFVAECRALGQPHRVLQAGERLDLPA
jgi:L-ascorbate metabolism protein UlaG (beta-lactamase superfamily)